MWAHDLTVLNKVFMLSRGLTPLVCFHIHVEIEIG
jgi:hypothetical protein